MVIQDLVNIGWGNGSLPDGTKQLPQTMLTYPERGSMTISWGQFLKDTSAINDEI